jgi:hypothetical protein
LGQKVSMLTDNINRLSGFIELLYQGVDPIEAGTRMKRAHVDYDSLTVYEKQLRDSFVPFYAYTSRIFREVVRQLAERPGGRYAQLLRTFNTSQTATGEDYVPSYLRDQWAIPFGEPLEDGQMYLADIDAPGIDALQTLGGAARGDFSEIPRNIALQSSPFVRAAVEQAFNRDLFSGRPLEQVSGDISRIAGANTPVSRAADRISQLVPFASRATNFTRKLLENRDELPMRQRVGNALLTMATGMKPTYVDDTQILNDQMRILLDANPGIFQANIPYVPSDLDARAGLEAAGDARAALEAYRALKKRRDALRAQ